MHISTTATLMSPTCNEPTLLSRYDCIEALLSSEKTFFDLATQLPLFVDFDLLLGLLVQVPKIPTVKTCKQSIACIIYIKNALLVLPELSRCFEPRLLDNVLLRAINDNITSPVLTSMIGLIDDYISPDCTFVSNNESFNHQIAFALKPGINGLLDVARKTYVDTLEEIHKLHSEYCESFAAEVGHFNIIPNPEDDMMAGGGGKKKKVGISILE